MYSIFESMEAELKAYKEKVDQIHCNLNISGAATYDLKQELKKISEDIEEEKIIVYRLKEVLEVSVRKYGMTEGKLSRSISVKKKLGDCADAVEDRKVITSFLNSNLSAMRSVNIPKDIKNAYFRNAKEIYNIEKKLLYLGYDVGKVDGVNTKETKNSVKQFQKNHGLNATGELDKKTKKLIEKVYKAEQIKNNDAEMSEELKLLVTTVYGEAANCSDAGQEAIANVIMNRVNSGEWSEYDSVTEIIQKTGFDAYTRNNSPYNVAEDYLNSRDTLNKDIEETISCVVDVYYSLSEDNTNGCVLYYSPNAQVKLHEVMPSVYDRTPRWDFSRLKEVKVDGAQKDDLKFYKYK